VTRTFLRLALFGLLASLGVVAYGQESAGASEGPQMWGVELEPTTDFPDGKAKYLQGEADSVGQRFKLEGTELDQPILVSVLTRDPADKVRVRIVKDDWDKPERDQSTAGATRLDFAFRTFDGFKVWVTADKPTEYQLIVWVGDPVDEPLPAVAVPASTFVEKPGASGPSRGGVTFSPLELALAGALALVLIGLVVFALMRRKESSGVAR
jgi:hypothetical protein